jgi:leucyl aminopeptidase
LEIKINTTNIIQSQSNVIVLPYFEEQTGLTGKTGLVDKELNGIITQLIKNGEIKGKLKEITTIYTLGKIPALKIMVIGAGKEIELNCEKIRVITAEFCKALKNEKNLNVDLVSFETTKSGLRIEEIVQSIAEGALLGSYTFNKYKNNKDSNASKGVGLLNVVVDSNDQIESCQKGLNKGIIYAEAAIVARDMVNEPANNMTPAIMAELAVKIADNNGLKVQVFSKAEISNLGMGGLLGVSQGSQEQPKLILLEYNGNNSSKIDLALVGKAITFDSGGISIKPSDGMGDMKGDMAGGASVIGTMQAIAKLKPQVHVIGVIPATENMPSGTAMRPGDIIKISNGKTIEIITTDAEGRLILADGICYARKAGANKIIDIATLTGAIHIALGDFCTGAFSNDQKMVNDLIAAGSGSGECLWQMPMNEEYKDLNKSDIADLKNSAGRYGSAIGAAWFLGEFAEKTPWVHLDIAGTSMADKEKGYIVKGGTGVPVRTLLNYILSLKCN